MNHVWSVTVWLCVFQNPCSEAGSAEQGLSPFRCLPRPLPQPLPSDCGRAQTLQTARGEPFSSDVTDGDK